MRALLSTCLALPLLAQVPMEMGPISTREMFPLYLSPQAYQPMGPVPIGAGRWEWSLDFMRANTFEFSELMKERAPKDVNGRLMVTRPYVEAHAAEFRDIPLIFFFDEEVSRTELRGRRGLSDHTDIWFQIPFQSQYGGWMDKLIEGFHRLGFKQFGRDRVAQSELTLVVLERGEISFFSQARVKARLQDPSVGILHRWATGNTWTWSIAFSLKPPITEAYDRYRSGWDPALALTGRWQPHPSHVFYAGSGLVLRTKGSDAYDHFQGHGFRHLLGVHGSWEWRSSRRIRPFFQLLWQSGQLQPQIYQKLDRPSLQHDVGFHWQIRPNAIFTFRYLNNLTHNANTADMGLGMGLRIRQ